jgi:hypothetical protein
MPEEFHERVRARFLELARADPQRYLVLDATLPREEIQAQIRRRVRDLVPLSPRVRAQLAEKLALEEEVRRRRADAEAEVLRLDAELRGRRRDESAARTQTLPVDHTNSIDHANRVDHEHPDEPSPTAVLELGDRLGDAVSDRGETLRP